MNTFLEQWRQKLPDSLREFTTLVSEVKNTDFMYGILATAILWPIRELIQDYDGDAIDAVRGITTINAKHVLRVAPHFGDDRLSAAQLLAENAASSTALRKALDDLINYFNVVDVFAGQLSEIHIPKLGNHTFNVDQIKAALVNQGGITNIQSLTVYLTQSTPNLTETSYLSTIAPPLFQAPKKISNFTGRQELIDQLKKILTEPTDRPVIGLVGLGGVGKTSLAVQVLYILKETRSLEENFPDGVLWVDLTNSDVEKELVSIAATFSRHKEVGERPDLSNKAEFIRGVLDTKKLLMVIDNATNSEQLDYLMSSNPNNRTLVTTRNDQIFDNQNAQIVEVTPWNHADALTFLRSMIGADRIDTELTAAFKIIKLVGGLPLALRFVVGYLRGSEEITLKEYAEYLQQAQWQLKLSARENQERSIYTTFEVSYGTLQSDLQQLFATLAIFDGPDFNSATVADLNQKSLLDVKLDLGQLRSRSFINTGSGERNSLFQIRPDDKVRYKLHPLVKTFALDKLNLRQDTENVRRQLALYYADLVEQNGRPEDYPVLDWEWQNAVGAFQWAYERQEWKILAKGGLGLTQNYLGQIGYLDARGYWGEAKKILTWTQEGVDTLDILTKARILTNLGGFSVRQADFDTALPLLQTALKLLESFDNSEEILIQKLSLYDFMYRAILPTNRQAAQQWLERGIEEANYVDVDAVRYLRGYLYIQLSSIFCRAGKLGQTIEVANKGLGLLPKNTTPAKISGLNNLGIAYQYLAQNAEAIKIFDEAVPLARELGDVRRLASLLGSIGWNEIRSGHLDKAVEYLQRALELYRRIEDFYHVIAACINIGSIYVRLNNEPEALHYLEEALHLTNKHRLSENEAFARSNLADLYLVTNQLEKVKAELVRAHEICEVQDIQYLLPTVLRQQAEIALAQEQLQEGIDLVERSLKLAHENQDREEQGIGWRVKGTLFNALHMAQEAEKAWRESLKCLANQDPYELARTKLTAAEARLKGKNVTIPIDQAKAWLCEALDTFAELGVPREREGAQTLINMYLNHQ